MYSSNKMNMFYKNSNQFFGDFYYLAPELLELTYLETFAYKNSVESTKDKKKSSMEKITKAVDYWALGIIIYEL